jgi:hypothetical protein
MGNAADLVMRFSANDGVRLGNPLNDVFADAIEQIEFAEKVSINAGYDIPGGSITSSPSSYLPFS